MVNDETGQKARRQHCTSRPYQGAPRGAVLVRVLAEETGRAVAQGGNRSEPAGLHTHQATTNNTTQSQVQWQEAATAVWFTSHRTQLVAPMRSEIAAALRVPGGHEAQADLPVAFW